MKRRFFAVALFIVASPLPLVAAEQSLPPPAGDISVAAHPKKPMKMKSKKPMRPHEPMPTGMAKDGMHKGDMKAGAAEKEREMQEMMHREEMENAPLTDQK